MGDRFAPLSFPFVLGFALFNGLPLHIARLISAATSKRGYMINNITRTRAAIFTIGRTRARVFELIFSRFASMLLCQCWQ